MENEEILMKLIPVFREVFDDDRIALAPDMTAAMWMAGTV